MRTLLHRPRSLPAQRLRFQLPVSRYACLLTLCGKGCPCKECCRDCANLSARHNAGQEAQLEYSLHYAAPEVIAAEARGAQRMRVSAAADMWAIGAIAFELLTGERVFAPASSPDAIRAVLLGQRALPWEDDVTAERLAPRLRVLRRSVLQCLSRDPEERPTSRELLGAWNGMFESLTGTTRDAFGKERDSALLT